MRIRFFRRDQYKISVEPATFNNFYRLLSIALSFFRFSKKIIADDARIEFFWKISFSV